MVLAIIADRRGMPHKWYTAIFGTTVPFGVVILSYPLRWNSVDDMPSNSHRGDMGFL